jgi:hypothetical protein
MQDVPCGIKFAIDTLFSCFTMLQFKYLSIIWLNFYNFRYGPQQYRQAIVKTNWGSHHSRRFGRFTPPMVWAVPSLGGSYCHAPLKPL